MTGLLEKNLAKAIDRRIAVFRPYISNGSILQDEVQLRTVAYLISEIVQPCCCMMCNKEKLKSMLSLTTSFSESSATVLETLSELIYNDLARCNGLG